MARSTKDYCWTGELAPFADLFARIEPSGTYRSVLRDVERDFAVATRQDYETALQKEGRLGDDAALADAPHLVAAVQAHWHAAGNTGCRFAMYLSEHRARFGWESWVMGDRDGAVAYAGAIDERVRERLEPAEVDVISLLLPYVEDPEELGDIVRALGELENWKVSDQGQESDPQHGDLQLLGLSLAIELEHWSEVLGFGPAAPLANTRRAPFTELAIRAKAPARPRVSNHRAYMADIEVDLERDTMKAWWSETEQRRAERLGDDHEARGKARVTTVVQIEGSMIKP
jgi:hypothetical protein